MKALIHGKDCYLLHFQDATGKKFRTGNPSREERKCNGPMDSPEKLIYFIEILPFSGKIAFFVYYLVLIPKNSVIWTFLSFFFSFRWNSSSNSKFSRIFPFNNF